MSSVHGPAFNFHMTQADLRSLYPSIICAAAHVDSLVNMSLQKDPFSSV